MTPPTECTLDAFAEATGLTTEFLRDAGVNEGTSDGRRVVRLSTSVAYLAPPRAHGVDDVDVVDRKSGKSVLFGSESLGLIAEADSVHLVADELEALTLRFHALPAIVVPPAERWEEGWPTLDDVPVVYVVVPADGNGDAKTPQWLADAPFRDRVRLLVLADAGVANMLHRHSERNFRQAWESVSDTAISWTEYEQQHRARLQVEHASRCADLVTAPDILERFAADLEAAGFAGGTREAKLLYLVATSRLLAKPISAAVKGPSSAGKSFLVKKVLEFFPAPAYLPAGDGDEPEGARLLEGAAGAPRPGALRGRRDRSRRRVDPSLAAQRGPHRLRHRRLGGRLGAGR
jgi:hypothetical protein